jgi:hypothetical protein
LATHVSTKQSTSKTSEVNMSEHKSKYPLNNEVDEPSIGAVYLILVVCVLLLVVSFVGLRSYEQVVREKQRREKETAPTVELNELRESNAARLAIVNKVLDQQAATSK